MQRAKEKQLMATPKKDVYKARGWKCYVLYSRWVRVGIFHNSNCNASEQCNTLKWKTSAVCGDYKWTHPCFLSNPLTLRSRGNKDKEERKRQTAQRLLCKMVSQFKPLAPVSPLGYRTACTSSSPPPGSTKLWWFHSCSLTGQGGKTYPLLPLPLLSPCCRRGCALSPL